MTTGSTSDLRVLVVDPLAADRGHLLDDDLFWATHLRPVVSTFGIATSAESARRLRSSAGVPARVLPALRPVRRLIRLRLVLVLLSLRTRGFDHVLFQSFEEISTALFALLHPGLRVHVIVTNNLSDDRVRRHPWLARAVLRFALRRMTTVFVHCEYEARIVRSYAGVRGRPRLAVKPFHQIAMARERPPLPARDGYVLFVGPETEYKPLAPVLAMIAADTKRRFRYRLVGLDGLTEAQRAIAGGRPNVEVSFGFIPAEQYYRLVAQAALLILGHGLEFEGRLSGVFCDAIASGTPVVAQDMAPHSEFFARHGAMGYLVDFGARAWWEEVLNADLAGRFEEFQRNQTACRLANDAANVVAAVTAELEAAGRSRVRPGRGAGLHRPEVEDVP